MILNYKKPPHEVDFECLPLSTSLAWEDQWHPKMVALVHGMCLEINTSLITVDYNVTAFFLFFSVLFFLFENLWW